MAHVVTEQTAPTADTGTRVRRRASRAAGPAGEAATARVASTGRPASPVLRSATPPRPQSHRLLVAVVAAATAFVLTAVLAGLVAVAARSERSADAEAARQQRFVDTASQTVVNMFSYDQDHIDDSIDRWIHNLSGPLRDQFSQPGTVDMLKGLFVDTKSDSEAVINAAALESIDEETNRASVLVAARVTATDVNDGVNQPSQPYRLRVIVQEDSAGAMTAYDLLWPNGGA
ncbi:mammalian cell entry protein [Mycobacterium sp. 1274756.6]|uniref:mammalian cell entry protein n=1 Tax=Mycobacterium sp. 1274756.6 TaxID=1834076 RepID=UPI0007FDE23D|nr:mammalian cell entry protein [Mycobacterium sp. 1274756.6]OBJ68721.1 mammalian cell entry protein [Mycobacterium sp. 1274756.6]